VSDLDCIRKMNTFLEHLAAKDLPSRDLFGLKAEAFCALAVDARNAGDAGLEDECYEVARRARAQADGVTS
jgi:hypothetical protein